MAQIYKNVQSASGLQPVELPSSFFEGESGMYCSICSQSHLETTKEEI